MLVVELRCEAWVNSSASTVRSTQSGPTFSSQSMTRKTGDLVGSLGLLNRHRWRELIGR